LGASPQSEAVSTVLAEVLPGIAVVFGDVPPELAIELIDLGLVSAT
jgi:actin-like ATPase involved in cell morphogenesis